MYEVFKRTWWCFNEKWPNGLEPEAGEREHIDYFDTEDEAREYCQYHNKHSLPENNPLSLKFEFDSI